jgi:hypothetical protein
MKTFFCYLLSLAIFQFANATVHTLCNMGYSPGTFTTFDDAQNAAINGDTIYVHGSSINYGNMTAFKSLVIIGTGHHPDKQNKLVSSFLHIELQNDNIQLIGLTFATLNASYVQNNVIKKCRITGTDGSTYAISIYLGDNWLIEGNIFDITGTVFWCLTFNGQPSANTIVQNNIFAASNIKISNLNNAFSQRTYILNNIFLGDAGYNETFNQVNYAMIENNIFYGSNPNLNNVLVGCTMNNNISYECYDNNFNSPGINNLVNVDPIFANFPPGYKFNYDHDFQLAVSSPGKNTGTDGTDRGVFGGFGYRFTATGEPSIAEITAFTITGPTTIPPGGTLNVSITSKRAH